MGNTRMSQTPFEPLTFIWLSFRRVSAPYVAGVHFALVRAMADRSPRQFHFESILPHTSHVLSRLSLASGIPPPIQTSSPSIIPPTGGTTTTSDWIAYSIMDSIIDSFFPLLDQLARECDRWDALANQSRESKTIGQAQDDDDYVEVLVENERPVGSGRDVVLAMPPDAIEMDEKTIGPASSEPKANSTEDVDQQPSSQQTKRPSDEFVDNDKWQSSSVRAWYTQSPLPAKRSVRFRGILHQHINLYWIPQLIREFLRGTRTDPRRPRRSGQNVLLQMASTRRLITSLSRLLASKSELLGQIRKGMKSDVGIIGTGGRGAHLDDVIIYLGDVQGALRAGLSWRCDSNTTHDLDHVITLQQSLAHLERVLSAAHPTFVSDRQLAKEERTRKMDRVLLYLSTVTISVICMQVITGTSTSFRSDIACLT